MKIASFLLKKHLHSIVVDLDRHNSRNSSFLGKTVYKKQGLYFFTTKNNPAF